MFIQIFKMLNISNKKNSILLLEYSLFPILFDYSSKCLNFLLAVVHRIKQ